MISMDLKQQILHYYRVDELSLRREVSYFDNKAIASQPLITFLIKLVLYSSRELR